MRVGYGIPEWLKVPDSFVLGFMMDGGPWRSELVRFYCSMVDLNLAFFDFVWGGWCFPSYDHHH